MPSWSNFLTDEIAPRLTGDQFWRDYLLTALGNEISPIGIHLAIFVEPYLTYVIDGRKTVESRFGVHRIPPYGQAAAGDIILLKRSGGPIVGVCRVTDVWYYNLDPASWNVLREEFTEALCAHDPEFWKQRERASFATLMRIGSVKPIQPLIFPKNDRRGWVVLRPPMNSVSLFQ
jgi:hypothetical protein